MPRTSQMASEDKQAPREEHWSRVKPQTMDSGFLRFQYFRFIEREERTPISAVYDTYVLSKFRDRFENLYDCVVYDAPDCSLGVLGKPVHCEHGHHGYWRTIAQLSKDQKSATHYRTEIDGEWLKKVLETSKTRFVVVDVTLRTIDHREEVVMSHAVNVVFDRTKKTALLIDGSVIGLMMMRARVIAPEGVVLRDYAEKVAKKLGYSFWYTDARENDENPESDGESDGEENPASSSLDGGARKKKFSKAAFLRRVMYDDGLCIMLALMFTDLYLHHDGDMVKALADAERDLRAHESVDETKPWQLRVASGFRAIISNAAIKMLHGPYVVSFTNDLDEYLFMWTPLTAMRPDHPRKTATVIVSFDHVNTQEQLWIDPRTLRRLKILHGYEKIIAEFLDKNPRPKASASDTTALCGTLGYDSRFAPEFWTTVAKDLTPEQILDQVFGAEFNRGPRNAVFAVFVET